MKLLVRSLLLIALSTFHAAPSAAQETDSGKAISRPQSDSPAQPVTPASPAAAAAAATAGQAAVDQAVIVLPATSEEASVPVLLRGVDEKPVQSDFALGLLKSSQQPGLLVQPSFELISATPTAAKGDYIVVLKVHDLVAFGDTTVPLHHRGRLVQLLHFSKPGLVAKASDEGGLVAREGSPLLIVLENPSAFEYKPLRARLRFGDSDVCVVESERFDADKQAPTKDEACANYSAWTPFSMPRYAQVTLRAPTDPNWFVDPERGFPRSGKAKGLLTLRYQSASAGTPIFEQALPLEVRFEPATGRIFRSLLWVALLLVAGAMLSLLLRVSLPNIKRRRDLKDQLSDIAKQTASISTEVDSNLRVLLRVERIALDEIRQGAWPFGPGYAEFAQRVERALPTVKRRVDAVRRLDAILTRRRLLAEQGAAPTRLDQVETLVDSVSETLMQDQLTDEEWVSVNQKLEAAQKILREPTQTEKEAFDAMLSTRWKNIREHFGKDGILSLPEALHGMESCIPKPSLLPDPTDVDGSQWINAVGSVRADLQLSALLLLREFEFLAPKDTTSGPWASAKTQLTILLTTPALDNLREAKRVLRELAEGVFEEDIKTDLRNGLVRIIMDPSVPRPNQKIRFTVCFRRDKLNNSAARQDVSCRWLFKDHHAASALQRTTDPLRSVTEKDPTKRAEALADRDTTPLSEDGWYVHHYFEKDVDQTTVSVSFYDSAGQPVVLPEGDDPAQPPWFRAVHAIRESRRPQEKWSRALLEVFQMIAALLIPLATLAASTLAGSASTQWWELIALGFGSDTIKSILVGRQDSPPP